MDSIGAAHHLESRLEAEYADWVGPLEHLQFQLYPESPFYFLHSAYHFVSMMLEPVRQAIIKVIHCHTVVYIDWFDDG